MLAAQASSASAWFSVQSPTCPGTTCFIKLKQLSQASKSCVIFLANPSGSPSTKTSAQLPLTARTLTQATPLPTSASAFAHAVPLPWHHSPISSARPTRCYLADQISSHPSLYKACHINLLPYKCLSRWALYRRTTRCPVYCLRIAFRLLHALILPSHLDCNLLLELSPVLPLNKPRDPTQV